ncbi:hypothetical protein M431DRAFT_535868 [Trichoderma harzianum CBS 226.95]|uniref:Uncharacterized protein n=1 Tax=Trichoderma harzianum CBS 226.95 TaxID=983964 RepID=A0A2T3ZTH2_TRIHA|nr:hypothetical protein M431DRAFT_535868 [Trichoderma harzianum CBS 226.95]PTB48096.1 hypothetical protein M431DRAFT_535868 [Trichoderma harzianum CBS 226.95]
MATSTGGGYRQLDRGYSMRKCLQQGPRLCLIHRLCSVGTGTVLRRIRVEQRRQGRWMDIAVVHAAITSDGSSYQRLLYGAELQYELSRVINHRPRSNQARPRPDPDPDPDPSCATTPSASGTASQDPDKKPTTTAVPESGLRRSVFCSEHEG